MPSPRIRRLAVCGGVLAAVGLAARAASRRASGSDAIMVGDCWPPVPVNEERPASSGNGSTVRPA